MTLNEYNQLRTRAAEGDDKAAVTLAWHYIRKCHVAPSTFCIKKAVRYATQVADMQLDDGYALLNACRYYGWNSHGTVFPDPEYDYVWRQVSRLAEDGNTFALFYGGVMLSLGRGVTKNLEKAEEWLQRAADKGLAIAMRDLALLRHFNLPKEADRQPVFALLQKAADGGDMMAVYLCGKLMMGQEGVEYPGVSYDPVSALGCLRLAAKAGVWQAQKDLATVYYYGRLGVRKDKRRAMSLTSKSDFSKEQAKAFGLLR